MLDEVNEECNDTILQVTDNNCTYVGTLAAQ